MTKELEKTTEENAEAKKENGILKDEEGNILEMDIPCEIPLQFPIQWGKGEDKLRETVTVTRRLKAKDFKGIRPNDIRFDDMQKLMSKVTGESRAFIEELDSQDMFELTNVINYFLPSSQQTGENQ